MSFLGTINNITCAVLMSWWMQSEFTEEALTGYQCPVLLRHSMGIWKLLHELQSIYRRLEAGFLNFVDCFLGNNGSVT